MLTPALLILTIQLADNRPHANDHLRFCHQATALANWVQARDFRTYAENMVQTTQPWPAEASRWEAIAKAAWWCERCWCRLDDAFCYSCENARRDQLDRLRKLLGDEAYYAGVMPSPVPAWMFAWID